MITYEARLDPLRKPRFSRKSCTNLGPGRSKIWEKWLSPDPGDAPNQVVATESRFHPKLRKTSPFPGNGRNGGDDFRIESSYVS